MLALGWAKAGAGLGPGALGDYRVRRHSWLKDAHDRQRNTGMSTTTPKPYAPAFEALDAQRVLRRV